MQAPREGAQHDEERRALSLISPSSGTKSEIVVYPAGSMFDICIYVDLCDNPGIDVFVFALCRLRLGRPSINFINQS